MSLDQIQDSLLSSSSTKHHPTPTPFHMPTKKKKKKKGVTINPYITESLWCPLSHIYFYQPNIAFQKKEGVMINPTHLHWKFFIVFIETSYFIDLTVCVFTFSKYWYFYITPMTFVLVFPLQIIGEKKKQKSGLSKKIKVHAWGH